VQIPIRKYYPPDTTACIFWLKNRKPDEWRDKLDHEVGGLIKTEDVGNKELARRLAFLIAQSAQEG
jgi:hypothetical protein